MGILLVASCQLLLPCMCLFLVNCLVDRSGCAPVDWVVDAPSDRDDVAVLAHQYLTDQRGADSTPIRNAVEDLLGEDFEGRDLADSAERADCGAVRG
ncbi:hypothetical protein [Xanthomonas hortorum]|uniref:hypothetical protein n=1 Tax=Xanthomonas hortorum TaxID=56454 RepID=UPI001F45CF44|nr:hypothetical protein [Xanthomonas hortorum]MCE4528656.1 hypothetical protein [Xanthomonas hortorum pv. vitians]MCE4549451.1 hypothetical protein [Xanthomonas hortorum pv. vitians]